MKKKTRTLLIVLLSVVLVLGVAVNVAVNIFKGYVDLFLGTGDIVVTTPENAASFDTAYYTSDFDSDAAFKSAAEALVEEIESEGIVLLKNNGALPLAAPAAVTLLGRDAADPVYGGSGSGGVNLSTVVDLKTGLEQAGYTVNGTVYDLLAAYASYHEEAGTWGGTSAVYDHPKANIVMDSPETSTYYIGEMPAADYTAEAQASFAQYADAAIVVFGRGGGEGGDLARDMAGWDDNYTPGQHQLELNQDEKDTLALAEANFSTVIVVINSSNVMELGILESDPNVDAVVWVGSPGQTGFNALGDVLSGAVNPSGRTADIYPADLTKDPTFVNFGSYQYSNVSAANATGNAYFVQYEEGIYIGYRYYETAAVEGFIDYDQAVVYPFGYGLSYTDFAWEITGQDLGDVDGTIEVTVEVTNTGSAAGKDVVELYYSAPYTAGGIEKSSVVLGAFAKTGLIAPGASESVTLTLAVEDMASYDYVTAKAYVLEEGDYAITIQTDSHNIKAGLDPITYTVDSTVVYSGDNHRASDASAVTNAFDDVSALITQNMSRADFAGTFPTSPTTADLVAPDAIIEAFQAYDPAANADPDAEMPTTGASNGLSLIDMRGLAWDDPAWELYLDQLTVDEMLAVIDNGAYNTAAVESAGKPATFDSDGPAGINNFMTGASGVAYPSEVVIASTWNVELAEKMGVMIGNEALSFGMSGWYAPAMNTHRSQFAGRNFEYYSEDGLLAGNIATAVVEGAAQKGVYCNIKHFAVNDQETNRVNNGVSSQLNEQALREIYLKPFELVIKNATMELKYISDSEGTVTTVEVPAGNAVMSSFNRIGGTWAGGSYALMTTVLRDEWGFQGFAITDFNLYDYMYVNQGIAAGTDLMLTFSSMKQVQDTTSATAVTNLREAMHNIMFTVANSNAVNGIAPGAIISYTMATWQKVLIAVDIALALLVAAGFALVFLKGKKKGEAEAEAAKA